LRLALSPLPRISRRRRYRATGVTEQDKKLLGVVCKALAWYPDGVTVEESANAIVVAVLAWSRLSDEAKQAAPEKVRNFMQGRESGAP